jgi:hypothetical protein
MLTRAAGIARGRGHDICDMRCIELLNGRCMPSPKQILPIPWQPGLCDTAFSLALSHGR